MLSSAGRALRKQAEEIPQQVLCASGQQLKTLGNMRDELSRVRDELFKALDSDA